MDRSHAASPDGREGPATHGAVIGCDRRGGNCTPQRQTYNAQGTLSAGAQSPSRI